MHSPQLVYIMDPMCSWCWGFAPVMQQLLEQAQAAGVATTLRVGGLRTGEQAVLDEQKRTYILQHWRAWLKLQASHLTLLMPCPVAFYTTQSQLAVLL